MQLINDAEIARNDRRQYLKKNRNEYLKLLQTSVDVIQKLVRRKSTL